jgi:hypothetical protein
MNPTLNHGMLQVDDGETSACIGASIRLQQLQHGCLLRSATAAHRVQVSVAVACLQRGHELLHAGALLLGDVQPPGGAVDGVHQAPLDRHRGQ